MREEIRMNADEALDAVVTRALEQAPAVRVPAEFAAKLLAVCEREGSRVKAQEARRRGARWGRRVVGGSVARAAGLAAMLLLVVGMCWLAPHSTVSFTSATFDMELLLLAELGGVAAWMFRRGQGVGSRE